MLPGIAVAAVIAALATLCGGLVPVAGSAAIAIVAGVAVRSFTAVGSGYQSGLRFAANALLRSAIVLSGFGLSFGTVVATGVATFPVLAATVAIAFVLAPFLGRALGVNRVLRRLVGVGTAICGASAIAAVAGVMQPDETDLALSLATIFFYNIAAVLIFPPLGHALHLSQHAFGLWAGTAINDTSSAVAAGFAYGREAGTQATIVKLTRATLILPIVAVIAVLDARARRAAGRAIPWRTIVPWFIVWFLAAALVNTAGAVPRGMHAAIAEIATFLITVALAAIGLQTDLRSLIRVGARPLALGFLLWVSVAATSLAVAHVTGR